MRLAATRLLRSQLLPKAGTSLAATNLTAAIMDEIGRRNLPATAKLLLLPLPAEGPGDARKAYGVQQSY